MKPEASNRELHDEHESQNRYENKESNSRNLEEFETMKLARNRGSIGGENCLSVRQERASCT